MKKYKTISCVAVAVMLAGLIVSACAPKAQQPQAQQLPQILHWTSLATGTQNYLECVGVTEVVKKHTSMDAKVEPTPGPTVWIGLMANKQIDFALQGFTDIYEAYTGRGVWKKPYPYLRVVTMGGPMYGPAMFTIPATGIKTVQDLRGKRCLFASGFLVNNDTIRLLLKGDGVSESDLATGAFLKISSFSEANGMLTDGKVDAIATTLNATLAQIKAAKGLVYITYSEKAAKGAIEAYPQFYLATVPSNFLQLDLPQLTTIATYSAIYSRSDLPDDVVYAVTKAIYDNYDELKAYAPSLPLWTLANATSQKFVVPFHPGAVKYFREKGVWNQKLDQRQKELITIEEKQLIPAAKS